MADEADEYSCVSRGKLNLKGDSGVSKKRKKNKDKKLAAQAGQVAESEVKQSVTESKRTPAEQAFQKMHDKMVMIISRFNFTKLVVKFYCSA